MTRSIQPEVAAPCTGRDVLDRFYSPPALATKLVSLLPVGTDDSALEPSAGAGSFLNAIRDAAPMGHVWGVDVDPEAPGICNLNGYDPRVHCVDFLEYQPTLRPTWILGNPPFNQAEAHARWANRLTSRHVGFLLRVGFLASAKRVPFWIKHPCRKVWPIAQRPREWPASYDYAFYWWDKLYEGPTILGPPVVWR